MFKILSFDFPYKKSMKRELLWYLTSHSNYNGRQRVLRFCFIAKDLLDQLDCRIPESSIFQERVKVWS